LIGTIFALSRFKPGAIAYAVGLYISAAYWFTSSTSFANPAVTVARMFTGSFSGIRAADAPMFVVAELLGALAAMAIFAWLLKRAPAEAETNATAEAPPPRAFGQGVRAEAP
jgi:glycerol uptake facilitator-like aquaporin